MGRDLTLGVALAVGILWVGQVGLSQTKPKSKGEEPKLENQKVVMKEMSACFKEMQALSGKIEKEKRSTVKLRKDLQTQAERMATLSEAWKPFVKKEKAKLADDLITASNDLATATKPTTKKSQMTDGVMAVRMLCAECHRGYKPKDATEEKKDTGAK